MGGGGAMGAHGVNVVFVYVSAVCGLKLSIKIINK